MSRVLSVALAGAAVATPLALAVLGRRGAAFGGGASQGGGAGTTFGLDEDGEFTPDEATYCAAQQKLADELAAMGPFDAFRFCAKNPRDPKCVALDEVDKCAAELLRHTRAHQDDAIIDAASGAAKKVGGVVFGFVDGALDVVSGKVLAVGALAVVGLLVYRRYAP